MNLQDTRIFLKELNALPRKKLGQNFLINDHLARKIVREVKKSKGPWVEIGPGPGALTRFFSDEEKNTLTLIEKDKKIAHYWEEKSFSVFAQDALKTNWAKLPSPITLFGNLPYQLAGPLILQMSSFSEQISAMIFMLQKEVSLRIRAKPRTKDYGLLSVMAQIFWSIQWIAEAGTKDFYPPPKVAGHVLKFQPEKSPVPADKFLIFLKTCFAQRRKKLIRKLSLSLSRAETLLSEMNKTSNIRAEELSPQEFVYLFKNIQNISKKMD